MSSRTWSLVLFALFLACVRDPPPRPASNTPKGETQGPLGSGDGGGGGPDDKAGDEGGPADLEAKPGTNAGSGEPGQGAGSKPIPNADPNTATQSVQGTSTVASDGVVRFIAPEKTSIVQFATTITIPAQPKPTGTLFVQSGLQPGGEKLLPIDNGLLQQVLTWGTSCAPGNQPEAYKSWWISAQYSNTSGKEPGYTGCLGGDVMVVAPGDQLAMQSILKSSGWEQKITNLRDQKSVTFQIDMRGQAQNWLIFALNLVKASTAPAEPPLPVADVVFTNTTFTMADSSPETCAKIERGPRDAVVGIKVSANGLRCSIDKIVLRALGVTATDPAPAGP